MDMEFVNQVHNLLLRKNLQYDDNGEDDKLEASQEILDKYHDLVDRELSKETKALYVDYKRRKNENKSTHTV